MRIIGGKLRGRSIELPVGYAARPTTDFAKEGLFNILDNEYEFDGLKVLDLFGGAGSISFEFASRGAGMVYTVELAPANASFIRSQAAKFHLDNLTVVRHNVFDFLPLCREKFDIIFADPPYDLPRFGEIPGLVLNSGMLHPGSVFIIEHSRDYDFSALPGFAERRTYGSVNFSIFSSY